MFVKNRKKKIFASILAFSTMLMCLIAPHLTIMQSKGFKTYGIEADSASQPYVEITTMAHSGDAGTKVTVDGIDWLVPVKYNYVTSYFGKRIHPTTGKYSDHGGMDLVLWDAEGHNIITNEPVIAARDGTVTATYQVGTTSAGFYVYINHGDGFATLYMHMSHYVVTSGYVKAGQVIGFVGSTGGSTGPHLHYEIRQNGTQIDPFDYLGLIES